MINIRKRKEEYLFLNLLIFYFNSQYPNNDTITLLFVYRMILDTIFNLQFHSLYTFNESEVIIGNVRFFFVSSNFNIFYLIYAAKITAIIKYQTKVTIINITIAIKIVVQILNNILFYYQYNIIIF